MQTMGQLVARPVYFVTYQFSIIENLIRAFSKLAFLCGLLERMQLSPSC
ncbi:MAG: hypothetical protein RJB45_1096 [Pseudomonadota bacterium]|jgi:hypothetical protein